MAAHLFGGAAIFGFPTRQSGPTGSFRAQEEQLPGVSGVRIYRLGREPEVWRIRGRLTAGNLASLASLVSAGKSYCDGFLYVFTDSGGRTYPNSQLMHFNPVGDYEGCTLADGTSAVTVEIDAMVRWVAPAGKGL